MPERRTRDRNPGEVTQERSTEDLSDEELDAYILTRLRAAGVDLDVLPEDDPDAPADRRRILASARRFLRTTPPAVRKFAPDVQTAPPAMYPAAWSPALDREG